MKKYTIMPIIKSLFGLGVAVDGRELVKNSKIMETKPIAFIVVTSLILFILAFPFFDICFSLLIFH